MPLRGPHRENQKLNATKYGTMASANARNPRSPRFSAVPSTRPHVMACAPKQRAKSVVVALHVAR